MSLKSFAIVVGLSMSSVAFACPGSEKATTASAAHHNSDADAATKCAEKSELVGSACSMSTHAMAQRVHADGKEITLTGQFVASEKQLASHVAAPFLISGHHVIANGVLDDVDTASKLALQGKVLEVDGVSYLLVLAAKSNS